MLVYFFLSILVGSLALSDLLMTEPIYGLSYSEINKLWWQHVKGIELDENPLLDKTGEHCHVGQGGPFWLLHGTLSSSGTANRSCHIPCNKTLVIPLCNIAIDTAFVKIRGEIVNLKESEIKESIRGSHERWCENNEELEVILDDYPIEYEDLKYARGMHHNCFPVFLPAKNLGQYWFKVPTPAGMYQAVADGFYVILNPLSPGIHTLHFGAGFYSVTYHLTIESC